MATSYLSPQAVAGIETAMRRLHATQLALQDGGISLVLSRWSEAQQDWVTLPAQTVAFSIGSGSAGRPTLSTVRSDAGEAALADGWLSKEEPFDVERDDLFALGTAGNEERATITLVLPVKIGIVRAGFRLAVGEL